LQSYGKYFIFLIREPNNLKISDTNFQIVTFLLKITMNCNRFLGCDAGVLFNDGYACLMLCGLLL